MEASGGIQNFAESIYLEIKKYFDVNLIDWDWNNMTSYKKGLMHFCPWLFHKNFPIEFTHYWHVQAAYLFKPPEKYLVTCHGNELLPKNLMGFDKYFISKILKGAEFIHVNSRFTKNLVYRLYDVEKDKIVVINPPVPEMKPKKLEHKKLIIGTISRFVKRKNIPNIIKALNILQKEGINFVYWLAGDGPQKSEIMDMLKTAKFEWKYFGRVDNQTKISYFYPSLDIFVLPSLELKSGIEGFGIVFLEANKFGIPVVASRTGGIEDAVKEGYSGVFCNSQDPEDIKNKILMLTKVKKNMKPKKWAKKFTPERIALKFKGLYDDIL